MNIIKNAIITIILLIALGVAAYMFSTRAPSAPSVDISNAISSVAGTYAIASSESVVRFEIDEVLRGEDFTAIGTTSQIAGTISVGTSSISIGEIKINARTFKTESSNRDGAIARLILKSENPENEFIVFLPKTIENNHALTETLSSYTVSGDLTISGMTKPTTFTVNAALVDGVIIGTAETTLTRSSFNLVIPNVPFVASVDDEFTVSASIVAR